MRHDEHARCAVDDRRAVQRREPATAGEDLTRHCVGATDRRAAALRLRPQVYTEDHVRVEHGDQRQRRTRSMSRHTRPTTVVSHARRFATASASDRLKRSQLSCTASSASLVDPGIR
jgi:hypothetical protein